MHASRVDWFRRLATGALLAALISPAVRNDDGLPLSTYPMYASARSSVVGFVTAAGLDASGERSTLSASSISGSRDRLVAQSFLNDAVERDDAAGACAEIAERVAGGSLVAIEVAFERHDTVARLNDEPSLLERNLLAVCEVGT